MSNRRILCLWFPRLPAERLLRQMRGHALPQPFAVVADQNGAQILLALNPLAEAAGLSAGQALRDATAMCPALITRAADPLADAAFLTSLRRWMGKFSPWVAEEPPASLVIDLTGCAHLFGGESGLLAQVEQDCADLGLSLRAGIADTRGAAWALARHGGRAAQLGADHSRNGDAIAQEARATRSRAANRRRGWERGGDYVGPGGLTPPPPQGAIAPPGRLREALSPLPVSALRLDPAAVEGLARLGLRRIGDLTGLPRAALARRFGTDVLRRLDQALGIEPEPVSPAKAPLHFAVRLTFPDPIGLAEDIEAGVERLLPPLCARLAAAGHGARRVRLQAFRSDGGVQLAEVGLARAAATPDRIRPLIRLKLDGIDPGFGIDCLRLSVPQSEPLPARQHSGPVGLRPNGAGGNGPDTALDDLVGKLGARLGSEAVTRLHPSESHVPEKAALVLAAAWSEPHAGRWPKPPGPRPLVLFSPEPLDAPEDDPTPPARFRWRRREMATRVAIGPERILPEWWLDDPQWRNGARDYWRVETTEGERIWIFFAHGGDITGGWYAHGA